MALIPSLCAALDRVAGDRVTLKEGEPPHVTTGDQRHPIARSPLTHAAVQAMLEEILTPDARRSLAETGVAIEQLANAPIPLTVHAAVVERQLSIELRRTPVAPPVPAPSVMPSTPEPQPEPEPSPEVTVDLDAPAIVTTASGAVINEVPPAHTPEPEPVAAPDPEPEPVVARAPEPEPVVARAPEPERVPEPEPTPVPVYTPPPAPVYVPPPAAVVAAPAPVAAPRVASREKPTDLASWIGRATTLGATALYLRAGQAPAARVAERIETLADEPLDTSVFERIVTSFAENRDEGWRSGANGEWIQGDPVRGHVTCQLFSDHLGKGVVIRLGQKQTSSLLHRQIPRAVRSAGDGDGLIVVSSRTAPEMLAMGSAVADWCGRRRGAYVITLRPKGTPVHDIAGAFVSQREFEGGDAEVAAAIRRAVHEAPDVLLVVAPPCDRAVREAVSAATGNRLVILAVVASTTPQALRALAGQQNADTDGEHRALLAQTFRAGFSFSSLRRLGGGRTYVSDLVTSHPEVSALMSLNDFGGIARLQGSGADGMRTSDETLARAVSRGHLSLRQAAGHTTDLKQLVTLVRLMRRGARPGATSANVASDIAEGTESSFDTDTMFAGVAAGAGRARANRWASR